MLRFGDVFFRCGSAPAAIFRRVATAIAFAALLLTPFSLVYSGAIQSQRAQSAELPRGELFIDTASGERRFAIEIARTPNHRRQGLMFRTELAADAGMLFVYESEREITMWMKNTLIPLDMLFIGDDGRIARIAERTTPMSEEHIFSRGSVRAVLELRGGTVNLLHIKTGDKVRSEALETRS